MLFFPYFVCAMLGVDSLRGGLAEGTRIFTPHRMLKKFRAPLVPKLAAPCCCQFVWAGGSMGGGGGVTHYT